MFPAFAPYIFNAVANNVNPCPVDVVGDANNPALYFGIDTTNIAFRLRLNGDPRKNKQPVQLDEYRWGVEIRDKNGNLLFTVEVDGKNDVYSVLIRDSSFNSIYSEAIDIGNNVDVTEITPGNFSCNAQQTDPDYLLDFQIPLSKFIINGKVFDFTKEEYEFCFYTSTSNRDNEIDKENPEINDGHGKCGPLFNQPLILSKTCPVPPDGNSFKIGEIVTITINVINPNMFKDAANVTVVDLLNIPVDVTIGSLTTVPAANSIVPSPGPYMGNVDITTTWNGLTISANTTKQLTISFIIADAPVNVANITNVDAGIGQLSGTTTYKCTIPVSRGARTRGIRYSDLIVIPE